jgi:tripartite-type tricarboxylate transporter receptor subunit TctC
MKRAGNLIVTVLIVSVVLFGYSLPASAASNFPEKPITFIIPFGAGGSTDILSRTISEFMKKHLPQPIIVINRPGGGGAVGVTEVVRAKPDGYTLGVVSNSSLVFPHMQDLAYKSSADFQPIIATDDIPMTLASPAKAPYKDLKGFIDACKANPGKLRVGMGSMGGIPHLDMALFMDKAGIKFNLVPNSGDSETIAQLLGGHVDAGLPSPPPLMGHVKAGAIRILGVLADNRYDGLPDAPTFTELGYGDAFVQYYHQIFGPKGLPEPILKFLHDSFKKALDEEGVKKMMINRGFIPRYRSTADLTKQMASDDKLFGELVKKLNLRK